MDDDGDGYTDSDEMTACSGEQAYSGYGSTSDRQDSASTPADMDGDMICDGLDMDRDGDGDFNYDVDGDGSVNYAHGDSEDVFPDDPSEEDDNDNDGTGDNADTDDDNDMWTDVLENTCSGSEADGFSNQYDASSLPDDYDGDMETTPSMSMTTTMASTTVQTHIRLTSATGPTTTKTASPTTTTRAVACRT